MTDIQNRKHEALRELGDADRAYRAAFQKLTTSTNLRPSSFRALLASVKRVEDAVRQLEEHQRRDDR